MNKIIKKADTADIEQTRLALKDIELDIKKWERIYYQIAGVDGVEIISYQMHEKIVELESLQFILKGHLARMGGR